MSFSLCGKQSEKIQRKTGTNFQYVTQKVQYDKNSDTCGSFCSTFRPKTEPTIVS